MSLTPMHKDAVEDYTEFKLWTQEAKPIRFIEYGDEGREEAQALDPKHLATSHDTCDNSMISNGFHDFGPEPRCCWVTHGWYVCEGEVVEDDMILESYYAQCTACNPNDEDEGENPDCESCWGDGWMTYHFEEYADQEGISVP